MGDFLVKYKIMYDDVEITEEILIYIEDCVEDELLEEVITEKLKEELECYVELIWFESLIDREMNIEEI